MQVGQDEPLCPDILTDGGLLDIHTYLLFPLIIAQAWEIAKTDFGWQESDYVEEHQVERYILAHDGKDWMSWGVLMVAWVDPIDKKRTKVTVVTNRRAGKEVATSSSETTFHVQFARAVEIVKAGKALPAEAPK